MYPYKSVVVDGVGTVKVPEHWSDMAAKVLATKYMKAAGVPHSALRVVNEIDLAYNSKGFLQAVDAVMGKAKHLFIIMPSTTGAETSAHQVFCRLVFTWAHFGVRFGQLRSREEVEQFIHQLYDDLYYQRAAPNSPQWFNTGLHYVYGISNPASGSFYIGEDGGIHEVTDAYERPQAGACFINELEDSLDSIMELATTEARLFRYGSGSGVNFSKLRGKNEPLSGGGVSSGSLSFLKIHDRAAGAIKSGGKTRRAAKMVIGDIDHPDIEEFISWKSVEERKVAALVAGSNALRAAGIDIEQYDHDWQGEAYNTVSGQNGNNTVSVSNKFLEAVEKDLPWNLIRRTDGGVAKTLPARTLWKAICHEAWRSGDPGLHFSSTINKYNTVPNDGAIVSSNPCLAGETLISTNRGIKRIDELTEAPFSVMCEDGVRRKVAPAFCTGVKPVLEITTLCGSIKVTANHLMKVQSGEDREAGTLVPGDSLMVAFAKPHMDRAYPGLITTIVELPPEPVYDITEPITSHFVANGFVVHNCSEYIFLNNTACNLASINIVACSPNATMPSTLHDNIREVAYRWTRVLDITVDMSQYPSKKIATECQKYRTLGLGYANIGAYLMRLGLPYDSDEARKVIGEVTAVLNYAALRYSSDAAKLQGPFPRFDDNADEVRAVFLPQIRKAVELLGLPDAAAPHLNTLGDFRNAQVSVLAPCGTIGFVMDCDTTGIEPDFALVKWKSIAGGGVVSLVNNSVRPALQALGYSDSDIDSITDYLMTGPDGPRNTLEGCPFLKPEHLPVFDCASAGGGTRSISWEGHVRAMAAAQPFLSGGISKTINMPNSATEEDVSQAFLLAHKLGLKAVAIYRDGSKNSQPLTVAKAPAAQEAPMPMAGEAVRIPLPDRRAGFTQKVNVGGEQTLYIRTGEFENGQLGEIFIDAAKQGDLTRSLLNAVAICTSIGLQYGAPLEEYVEAFKFSKFEPSGVVFGHSKIRTATSMLDLIFRVLEDAYVNEAPAAESPALPAPKTPAPITRRRGYEDASCPHCGNRTMVRNGVCLKCVTCGETTGCS